MFDDLIPQIEAATDLDETAYQAFVQKVAHRIAQNRMQFASFLAERPFVAGQERFIFYEAWAKTPLGSESAILQEIQRMLQAGQNGQQGALEEIDGICTLAMIETPKTLFYSQVAESLLPFLHTSHPEIRSTCFDVLLDLIEAQKISLNPAIRQALQSLLEDALYQLRRHAYQNLQRLNLLPVGYQPRLQDRLRNWL